MQNFHDRYQKDKKKYFILKRFIQSNNNLQ